MDQLESVVPESLRGRVEEIGSPVVPGDINSYERYRHVEDQSHKLKTVLAAWEKQHREERNLRKQYAKWLLIALFGQTLLVNVAFFMLGLKWIMVDEWTAKSFILAVFAEIVTMTSFIIKYLFPKVSADVLATLEKL